MAHLCKQLSASHFSARLPRAADAEVILSLPKNQLTCWMLHELPFARDLDCNLPNADRLKKKLASELLDELHFAGETWDGKRGLPSPDYDSRSCWAQPVLGYSFLQQLWQACKEVIVREGKKDISWRRNVMDVLIENDLLCQHSCFAYDLKELAGGCDYWQEKHSRDTLMRELYEDAY